VRMRRAQVEPMRFATNQFAPAGTRGMFLQARARPRREEACRWSSGSGTKALEFPAPICCRVMTLECKPMLVAA
jgi:hypothetical protein